MKYTVCLQIQHTCVHLMSKQAALDDLKCYWMVLYWSSFGVNPKAVVLLSPALALFEKQKLVLFCGNPTIVQDVCFCSKA